NATTDAVTGLTALSVSGTTTIKAATITGTGDQAYTGAVTVMADATLTSTGGGAIKFAAAVDGGYALTVNTTGVTTFGGKVGSGTPLAALTTDGPGASVGGTTALTGGTVTTTGAQTYNDRVAVGLSAADAATLASTTGGAITFAAVDGPGALTVNTKGATTFAGPVGATALAGLTTDAPGTTAINGG